MPPEKPLQLANTIRGRCSRLKSEMAWAVLKAESGNHTWPACCRTWGQHTGQRWDSAIWSASITPSKTKKQKKNSLWIQNPGSLDLRGLLAQQSASLRQWRPAEFLPTCDHHFTCNVCFWVFFYKRNTIEPFHSLLLGCFFFQSWHLTALCQQPQSEPKIPWSPWKNHGQKSRSARRLSQLHKRSELIRLKDQNKTFLHPNLCWMLTGVRSSSQHPARIIWRLGGNKFNLSVHWIRRWYHRHRWHVVLFGKGQWVLRSSAWSSATKNQTHSR